ncbi:hypothetical protein KO465_01070 [Candidatus Micrarchaeota archaeon]|nr:hypothetical protein [Candidatus Micrarchaeota archaeon]
MVHNSEEYNYSKHILEDWKDVARNPGALKAYFKTGIFNVSWSVSKVSDELNKSLQKAAKNGKDMGEAIDIYKNAIIKFPSETDRFNQILIDNIPDFKKIINEKTFFGKNQKTDILFDTALTFLFMEAYESTNNSHMKDDFIDFLRFAGEKIYSTSSNHPEGYYQKGKLINSMYLFSIKHNLPHKALYIDQIDASVAFQMAANRSGSNEEKLFYLAEAAWVYAQFGEFRFRYVADLLDSNEIRKIPRINVWENLALKALEVNNPKLAVDCYNEALKITETVYSLDYRKMKINEIEAKKRKISA